MIKVPFITKKTKATYLTKDNIVDVLGAETKVWQTLEVFSKDLNNALINLLRKYSLELRKAKKDIHYWKKRCERLERKSFAKSE